MIRYSLACEDGHTFESWFQNAAAYDKQAARKLINCPVCGSMKVEKTLMAPALANTKKRDAASAAALPEPQETKQPVAIISEAERELRTKLKEIHDHLTKNSDNVGAKFPEEARRMHYGEIDHRSIYGEASLEDAAALYEEGIEFHPLPRLPDEGN